MSDAQDANVLVETESARAVLRPSGRVEITREGRTVCNVASARLVDARAVERDGEAWLALSGAVFRVDFARYDGDDGLVGPFTPGDAGALAAALRDGLVLPRAPRPVTVDELVARPESFHETLLECDGVWTVSSGRSEFAGAWVFLAPSLAHEAEEGVRRVRVRGFWRCAGERDFDGRRTGHGPHAMSAAEIEVIAVGEAGGRG